MREASRPREGATREVREARRGAAQRAEPFVRTSSGGGHGPQGVAAGAPVVLLASRSPRRRELLERAGIRYIVLEARLDDAELSPGRVSAAEWVGALAYLKAAAALEQAAAAVKTLGTSAGVLLGADTVVVKAGRIIGQPRDAADAAAMIRSLADTDHDVLTGVALVDPKSGRREIFADRASVEVGPISDEQVQAYVESGQWRGKAGAYNLNERLSAGWPIRYRGDAGTIMGLPIDGLAGRLASFAAA